MATAGRRVSRPWQDIAAELSKEMDSDKVFQLSQDLIEALDRRDGSMAALARGPELEKLSKRLLFVDDEAGIRATLPIILRERGFDVSVAASIPEALQKIQHQQFDALLSDLNIGEPGDGFTVVHAIRQLNPQCVAVILTGYPGFDTAVTGIHEKIDDYFVKPADVELLIASLEKRLSKHRS